MEAIITSAITAFFLINFQMVFMARLSDWDWDCIKAIVIIDSLFILLVFGGIVLASVL
jgi:hypothetical protein